MTKYFLAIITAFLLYGTYGNYHSYQQQTVYNGIMEFCDNVWPEKYYEAPDLRGDKARCIFGALESWEKQLNNSYIFLGLGLFSGVVTLGLFSGTKAPV